VANVQFGGLITGLDTKALIAGLVAAESRPIDLLQNQKTVLQAKQGVYASLVGALGSLKSDAQALSLAGDFNKRAAESSDATVLKASADSTSQPGVSAIAVDTLAKAQSIQSTGFTSASDAIGTGSLTLQVGGTATTITIDSTNNTLTGLQNAIRNSGAKVSAAIVNVGSSAAPDFRLVVQSKDTGVASAVTISGTLSGGADPFAGGGQVVQAAADALVSVNGLTVSRASNTISDVVPGVTLVLLKEGNRDGVINGGDVSANVTITSDNSAIQDSIQQFIDSYNAVNKIVNDQFAFNQNSQHQGTLAGDASLRGVISRLRNELSRPGGIGVGFKYLSDIGISFQKDGSLTLDEAKLNNALDKDPAGVSDLFTLVQNGVGKRIPDAVDDFIGSLDGTLTARQKGIQSDIDRLDGKIASEQERVAGLQERLTQQFSALEQLVSQLKSQGDFLAQHLTSFSTPKN